MRRASIFLAVLVVGLLAAPSSAFAYYEVFERTYKLPSGGSFALSNVNGSVQVETWNREEVQIRAVKESKANPPDESRVRIEVETSPGGVAVYTRYPQEDGLDVTVNYRIRLPKRLLHAHIETVNGSVRIRGLEAAGELRTVNGDVELLDGAGHLSARTTNGNIRLELANLGRPDEAREPISVETVNGSVVLELSASADANLEVRSMDGDFQSELPLRLESSSSGQDFRGRLGRGGSTVRVRTVNGGIRVIAARDTA